MENLTAGQKLDRAFDKLGKERSLSFELDLDADAATLKAMDSATKPADKMPDEVAELISGARLSVSMRSKKPIEESGEKDFTATAMKLGGPDGDLLEYRQVGDYTYFRADVAELGKATGNPMPSADELPDGPGPFKKVLAGQWVKVATKELEETRDQLDEVEAPEGRKPSAEPTLDARTQKKLVKALRQVVAKEVDFKTGGGADGTEHIKATAPARTLMTKLVDELRPLSKELPPGTELPTAKELEEVPNKKVTADFTLKNGALTEVSVDLAALAENTKVKKLALVVRVGEGQEAKAPAGATEVKLDELMADFFQGGAADAFAEEDFEEGAKG
ncbi:hypothetical protein [Streptomyces albidochromogenes]|uniref:Uncharacterized protein n=1 Tax=Streptomyces albidochromogenes TaxID=329524 RepID=A0ABW6FGS2_9ACTN